MHGPDLVPVPSPVLAYYEQHVPAFESRHWPHLRFRNVRFPAFSSRSEPRCAVLARGVCVVADLLMFEGLSHAQYLFDANAPESKEHFVETAAFFDKYLQK